SEGKIQYRCESIKLRDQTIPGCGYEGEVDYRSGEGKLSWKVEFAVRWSALEIDFEAYGKDIADSVRVNDVIMKQVLHKNPPHHVQYEMFLDKSGRKISKSLGNVFTPQVWLRYGSPESLMLLMYKRIVGTRELSIEDIPKYMDELDDLEDIYFNKKKIKETMEYAKLKGLYEYCTLLKPPSSAHIHIPYATLLELSKVAPPRKEKEFILEKLGQYDVAYDRDPEGINKKIRYALNWIADFQEEEKKDVIFNDVEKEALKELIKGLKDATDETAIQNLIFSIAKTYNIPIKKFFQLIYMILLNKLSGPKLGSYILSMGRDTVIGKLQSSIN
ncbi:lysine--tRNA ligase, partial [[Eubacterium] cellulosolvens]